MQFALGLKPGVRPSGPALKQRTPRARVPLHLWHPSTCKIGSRLCASETDDDKSATVADERSGVDEAQDKPQSDGPSILGQLMPEDADLAEFEKDKWDGEGWQWLGILMENFLPIVAVLGIAVGGLAATLYNTGATVFVKPATEDTPGQLFIEQEK